MYIVPLACSTMQMNVAIILTETTKTEAPCLTLCGTIKIRPSLKAVGAEDRPKCSRPLPFTVTSQDIYECTFTLNKSILGGQKVKFNCNTTTVLDITSSLAKCPVRLHGIT